MSSELVSGSRQRPSRERYRTLMNRSDGCQSIVRGREAPGARSTPWFTSYGNANAAFASCGRCADGLHTEISSEIHRRVVMVR